MKPSKAMFWKKKIRSKAEELRIELVKLIESNNTNLLEVTKGIILSKYWSRMKMSYNGTVYDIYIQMYTIKRGIDYVDIRDAETSVMISKKTTEEIIKLLKS